MRSARTGDRVLVAAVGLVALVAGSYGLARNLGAFGGSQGDVPLLGEELRRTIADHAGWVGGLATFVALVLAWAGWRWLRRQLTGSSSPLRRVRVTTGAGGDTSVDGGALSEAVVRDLEDRSQVSAARARLVGQERTPRLHLAVDLAASADLHAVRRQVEDHVLPRARAALERDDLAATVRLRLAGSSDRGLE